ncbi:MAG: HEPN domain-containing protein [Patescibacteria group bacterium]
MSNEERVKYWLDSAVETREVANESYTSKHYDWAFFQWHLAIEKLFKGIISKKDDTPIFTHDLLKLAKQAGIPLSQLQQDWLNEITTYSIDARYDDYKRSFYKKVTEKVYREKWQALCEEVFVWLQNKF